MSNYIGLLFIVILLQLSCVVPDEYQVNKVHEDDEDETHFGSIPPVIFWSIIAPVVIVLILLCVWKRNIIINTATKLRNIFNNTATQQKDRVNNT
ncbi:17801_t:CDS:2, partial [Cetraspora pellucida]